MSWIKDKAKCFHKLKLETSTQSISSNCCSGFFRVFFFLSFRKVLWNNWNLSGLEVKNKKEIWGFKSVISCTHQLLLTIFSWVSSVWNDTAFSVGFVERGTGYGHTRYKTLSLSSSHPVPWISVQTTWLILCKICPHGKQFSTAHSSFAYICHKWHYIKPSQLMQPLPKGKKTASTASLPHWCSWPHKATSVKKPFTWIYTERFIS